MYTIKDRKQKTFLKNVTEFISLLLVVFIIRTFGFGLYQVPTGSMEETMLVGERFFADKFTYLFRAPIRGEIISFNDPQYEYSNNPVTNMVEQYVYGPSNWTKRVIGVPGDVIRGEVEDGKPVIFVNNRKIDEPYVNQHPLIHMWKQDPALLKSQIEDELKNVIRSGIYDEKMMKTILSQKWANQTTWRSYDPVLSYENQNFYRINPAFIVKNEDGSPYLLHPNKPISSEKSTSIGEKKRFWNCSDQFHVELGPDEYWCMGDNRLGSHDCRFFGPIKQKYIHGRILFRIWSIDSDESWWTIDLLRHPVDFWKRVRWNRFLQWVY